MPNRLSKLDTQPPTQNPSSKSQAHQKALSTSHITQDLSQMGIDLPPPPRFMADGAMSPYMSPQTSRPSSRGRPETPPPTGATSATLTPPDSRSAKVKRKSWLPGSRKTSRSEDVSKKAVAWIAGYEGQPPYDATPLVRGMIVPELWDEDGDTLIYLFPKTSGLGPSFRIKSAMYSSSKVLTKLGHGALYSNRSKSATGLHRKPLHHRSGDESGDFNGNSQSSTSSTRTQSDENSGQPARSVSIHLPLNLNMDLKSAAQFPNVAVPPHDLDTLVTTRNMFAFLMGQSLVATERRPTMFSIFMAISETLKSHDFSNIDGSTFGEVASASFENYVAELGLNDVRASREKTLEGLILGERMRSVMLYNEAFTHAVGRYGDLQDVKRFPSAAAKFKLVSSVTLNRMERAAIDLGKRQAQVNLRLSDFDLPSLWAGIVASKMADEGKVVRFPAWRENFMWMRKHVMAYYKDNFGSWPPKATAKNDIEISGLNRLVLKTLYRDFSALYDLLVDRTSLTTRTSDTGPSTPPRECSIEESTSTALRKILDEFDHSLPPVQPPIPYDLPHFPATALLGHSPRDAHARTKKLSPDQTARVLQATYNRDALRETAKSPFVASMLLWESKAAKGSSVAELVELRVGIWLFTYIVLNSLPMLVVDAPGLAHTRGVEYFLCEPPRSGVPWANAQASEAARGRKTWYGVAGGVGVVSLPSDLVEHGVEGVYRRSHCWQMAARWGRDADAGHESSRSVSSLRSSQDGVYKPVLPPPTIHEPALDAPNMFAPEYTLRPSLLPRPRSPSPSPSHFHSHSHSHSQAASQRSSSHTHRESVLALGLEALPLPAGVSPSTAPTPSTTAASDPAVKGKTTFDDIFAAIDQGKAAKKSKEKKAKSAK